VLVAGDGGPAVDYTGEFASDVESGGPSMCIVFLVLAVVYLLALLVLCVMVLATGAVTGGLVGALVGATRGHGVASAGERRLRAYHGGCAGALLGLAAAGVLLGLGLVVLFQ
jgi:hypothetical protein